MSQVFGDSKRLVNDYMAVSHVIGIRCRLSRGMNGFRPLEELQSNRSQEVEESFPCSIVPTVNNKNVPSICRRSKSLHICRLLF